MSCNVIACIGDLNLVLSKFRRKIIYKFIANLLSPGGSVLADSRFSVWERKNWWLRKAGIKIGKGVIIDHGLYCLTGLEENIAIEDHAILGVGVKIWNFNSVEIGTCSLFAADVHLVNGGHDRNTLVPFSGTLKIGRGCWIGNGARIIGPLTIGDHVIVGAGAVVIRNVPSNSIVAGVPARIIGTREIPEKVWYLNNSYFNSETFQVGE